MGLYKAGLNKALEALKVIRDEDLPQSSTATPEEVLEKMEAENALLVGKMIVRSALLRKESRGARFRKDFPKPDDTNWRGNIFLRKADDCMCMDYKPLPGKTV
jgi:fumarate reductase (CoM/CoB) subunit A